MRVTGPLGEAAVVCVNGGQRREVPGTWSASLEWLVARLARRFPALPFVEVRYRVKSWRRLAACEDDARAAIRETRAARVLLVGFSMGGAVAIAAAAEPGVEHVVGLAPWIPDALPVEHMRGRRIAVVHGSLDRGLPGIPGVSPASSRRGYERILAAGGEGGYTLVRGGVHGVALRSPLGRPVALPRARRVAGLVEAEVRRFAGS